MKYDKEGNRKDFPSIKEPRKKVALVGFASTTRHLAPYDDPEWEIWCLNEAHHAPWLRRITRWFQIHQEWDFMKGGNQSYEKHRDWLQEKHDFPIYTQKDFKQIPSGVVYPLDEVVDTFLGGVKRGEKVNKYFTSSYSYMMALALLEDFDVIGTWGFEMATDTEFRYQKGSTEFWMGLAAGLGKELYIPPKCQLLSGAMYGWEASRMINRQRLEYYEKVWARKRDEQLGKYQQINGKRNMLNELASKAPNQAEKSVYEDQAKSMFELEMRALNTANAFSGRVQMIEDLIKIVDMMHKGEDPLAGKIPMDDKSAEGDIDYDKLAEESVKDDDALAPGAPEAEFVEVPPLDMKMDG
jgi:hypothetical protein